MLQLTRRRHGEFDLYEALDPEPPFSSQAPVFSCVAICRRGWSQDWPALGGTRWLGRELSHLPFAEARERAVETAVELAQAMRVKNTLLRHAERSLAQSTERFRGRPSRFGWQGGKGVLWTPYEKTGRPDEESQSRRRHLTPHRLICHGRLVDSIGGEYFGSEDQGVGSPELKWISAATRYTIGLGCGNDTGEGTAHGVLSGLRRAAREQGLTRGAGRALEGVHVLVVGAGKVGIPLVKLLDEAGAIVSLFDVVPSVDAMYANATAKGGAVDVTHLSVLRKIAALGRVYDAAREAEALADPALEIISPNGGRTGWLAEPLPDGRTRARAIAEARLAGGRVQLVAGAGNDQIGAGGAAVLAPLAEAGITFVPDQVVSPGGVIAVSHELAKTWDNDEVNRDAEDLVAESVRALYAEARRLGGVDARTMYTAFVRLVDGDGYGDALPA